MLNFSERDAMRKELEAVRGVGIVLLMTAAMGVGAVILGKILEFIVS